jgi:tetratricopeptide (TPR) repeat protein
MSRECNSRARERCERRQPRDLQPSAAGVRAARCPATNATPRATTGAMSEDHWDAAQPGAELVAEGDYEAAVHVLTDLIETQPDNEYAYFYLGAAYYELEDYPRALKAYVKALEVVPGYVGAMVNAGHTLRMLGRYEEAIRMGQQVLARAADDGDGLFLIGAASFARGDYAKAKGFLERFLNTNPEIEVAVEVEGMLQVIRGKLADLN